MTQNEKISQARVMAMQMKCIANNLRRDAKDYDVRFPLKYADDLTAIADKFLTMTKPKR